jgi:hypothetical protein
MKVYLVVAAYKADDDCILLTPLHAVDRPNFYLRVVRSKERREVGYLRLVSVQGSANRCTDSERTHGVITAICEGSTPASTCR